MCGLHCVLGLSLDVNVFVFLLNANLCCLFDMQQFMQMVSLLFWYNFLVKATLLFLTLFT